MPVISVMMKDLGCASKAELQRRRQTVDQLSARLARENRGPTPAVRAAGWNSGSETIRTGIRSAECEGIITGV